VRRYSYDRRQAFVVNSLVKLYAYLSKKPWEKALEVAQRHDAEGDITRFFNWLVEHYSKTRVTDPLVQAVLDDPDKMYEVYFDGFQPKTLDAYYKSFTWVEPSWYRADNDAPSWFHLSNPKIVKNQWLIHFTNDAKAVACAGFKHGVSNLEELGGATSNAIDAKRSTGKFNFAYQLSDPWQEGFKYAHEAVLFKASGVVAWHDGDQENQVVFQGNTAKDIVPLVIEFGDWFANGIGKGGRPDQDGFRQLPEAVRWVTTNFNQYKALLTC